MFGAESEVLEAEVEPQAARDDGGQEHGGAGGGEEDEGVSGRLLERFQKGVGRAGGAEAHALGVEDDGNLERRGEGAEVELSLEFADLLDGDVARFRFGADGMEVGVLRGRAAEDLAGEAEGELLEGVGAVAGEEVGMAEASALDAGGEAFSNSSGRKGIGGR